MLQKPVEIAAEKVQLFVDIPTELITESLNSIPLVFLKYHLSSLLPHLCFYPKRRDFLYGTPKDEKKKKYNKLKLF